jgi:hypothetical protein
MKNIILFLTLLFLFQSCGNKEKQRTTELREQKKKSRFDSLELINQFRIDSIAKIQEKIAVGNINFGISKTKYIKEKKAFLKTTNGKLGNFKFSMRSDFYDNNRGLRHLRLYSETRDYNHYKDYMSGDFEALKDILNKKYGKPTEKYIHDDLPHLIWKIRNKNISLTIIESNYKYTILLYFKYQTQEERNKIEKGIKERKKESIKKALENL